MVLKRNSKILQNGITQILGKQTPQYYIVDYRQDPLDMHVLFFADRT